MMELSLEDRDNGLWFKEDEKYVIIVMYRVNQNSEPKFVRSGPLNPETVQTKVERMLNDAEQGRFVNLNTYFLSPDCIISIKVDKWKGGMVDSKDRDDYYN